MGRKGKLAPEALARVSRALAASSGSENNTLQIYNALQDDEEDQLKPGLFKRLVRRRLEPAAACFEERKLPGHSEDAVSVFLPKFKALLHFYAGSAPEWAEALFRALQACGDSCLKIIVYSDDVTCGNILAPRQEILSLLYRSSAAACSLTSRRGLAPGRVRAIRAHRARARGDQCGGCAPCPLHLKRRDQSGISVDMPRLLKMGQSLWTDPFSGRSRGATRHIPWKRLCCHLPLFAMLQRSLQGL